MKKIIGSGLILLMIIALCSSVYGAEAKKTSQANLDTKIERGAKNVALGWTEIPKSIINTTKEKNILFGITAGTLKGIANAFSRTVSGAADVTTAPIGEANKPAIKPTMIKEETK